jgi:NADP-dependent 3-hydroxy acid dehydrogenase YdfG
MNLVLTARREDRLREACENLGNSAYVAGDISSPEIPDLLVEKALSEFGRFDVLINNAGILEIGSITDIDLERACRMVRVNVEAAYRLSYTAVRQFQKQGSGYLINLSSILGTKTRPTAGAYAGTKFAIEALSEALRLELVGTGVRVSAVEPGLVMTELHNHMPVHPKDSMKVEQPLRPEDIARCIRFVLEQPEHVVIPQLMVLPRESPI